MNNKINVKDLWFWTGTTFSQVKNDYWIPRESLQVSLKNSLMVLEYAQMSIYSIMNILQSDNKAQLN